MNHERDYHIKHLELIQGVINRQAQNSFAVKGWSLTLSAGILTYLLSQSASNLAHPAAYFIVVFPALTFWLLDGYYLRQERLFRCLYDEIRRTIGVEVPTREIFTMDTTPYKAHVRYWRGALWGKTVWLIPAMIVAASIVLFLTSNHP